MQIVEQALPTRNKPKFRLRETLSGWIVENRFTGWRTTKAYSLTRAGRILAKLGEK